MGGSPSNPNSSVNMGLNYSAINQSGLDLQMKPNRVIFKEPENFQDEEYDEILEYVGLIDKGMGKEVPSEGKNKIFTKEELYNYIHGKGGGVFKQLKQYFRIQSMQY